MNTIANNIKGLLDSYSAKTEELEEILKNASASSLVRILLLHKLIKENHPSVDKLRQDTAFFTGNIPWYNYLIWNLKREKADVNVDSGTLGIGLITDNSEVENIHHDKDNSVIGDELKEGVEANSDTNEIPSPDGIRSVVINEENINSVVDIQRSSSEGPEVAEQEKVPENPDSEVSTENSEEADTNTLKEEPEVTESEKQGSEVGSEIQHTIPAGVEAEQRNEGPIAFEPLHTVDYFASQGIRINEDELANDKLTQQVKSFTGWLKSMKRLHPGKLPEQDEVIERIIQNASEASNVEEDVLTEAMAEVLVKQNKKDKAIAMYEKLSLMNPHKSAYFAAKIERLKSD